MSYSNFFTFSAKSLLLPVFILAATTLTFATQLDENGDHSNVESLGQGVFWDSPENMFLSDSLLILSTGETSISIVNISDPLNPFGFRQYDPGFKRAGVSGIYSNYLFFTEHEYDQNWIKVYDVWTNEEISTFNTGYRNPIKKISAFEDRVYILQGGSLDIIDIILPAADDTVVSNTVTDTVIAVLEDHNIEDFYIDDAFIFVADASSGLKIIDLSHIAISSLPFQGSAKVLSCFNDIVVVGTDDASIHIVDVSNPPIPVELASLNLDASPNLISIDGSTVFVTDISNQLYIIDLSNTSSPVELANYQLLGRISTIIPAEDKLYLLDNVDGITSLDITNLSTPTLNWTFGQVGNISHSIIDDNTLYISDFNSGLKIYDITDPENLDLIGQYDSEGEHYELWHEGDVVYLLNRQTGLNIIDVSDPASPSLIWSEDEVSFAENIIVQDNYTYLLSNYNDAYSRLHVFDISDLSNPVLVSDYLIEDACCRDIVVRDNLIYLMTSGIIILDCSDISRIYETDRLVDSSIRYLLKLDLFENYAFACEYQGSYIFNIADPYSIQRLSQHGLLFCNSMSILDNFAFYANGSDGFKICNIANPLHVPLVGFYDTNFYAYNSSVSNGKIFLHNKFYYQLFDYSEVLDGNSPQAFDLTSPTDETTVQSNSLEVTWTAPEGATRYVVWYSTNNTFTENFNIVDTQTNSVTLPDLINNTTYWWKVKAVNDSTAGTWSNQTWAFQTDFSTGVDNEQTSGLPDKYELSKVYPNPFNPTLNVEVSLPESNLLKLAVYNLLGREVAVLNEGEIKAGYHSFVFDGSTTSSGIYFIKASIPGELDVTRKVVLMK